jgi:hypothetical protein
MAKSKPASNIALILWQKPHGFLTYKLEKKYKKN